MIFVFGVFSGFGISRIKQFQGVSEALVAFGELHYMDKYISVQNQIDIYEAYQENFDRGTDFQKRILAIAYDEGSMVKFVSEHDDSESSYMIRANESIAEFLGNNPLQACIGTPAESMLECNLNNKLKFEKGR
tara:strand:+ start:369 stop:767 length:399 start_codon:yes stop_codon:yes gene_type:complete